MNPLILSLICLLLVGVSANWLSIVKNNKTLIYLSLAPCVYIAIYGIYLVIGPIDLYEDPLGKKLKFIIKVSKTYC